MCDRIAALEYIYYKSVKISQRVSCVLQSEARRDIDWWNTLKNTDLPKCHLPNHYMVWQRIDEWHNLQLRCTGTPSSTHARTPRDMIIIICHIAWGMILLETTTLTEIFTAYILCTYEQPICTKHSRLSRFAPHSSHTSGWKVGLDWSPDTRGTPSLNLAKVIVRVVRILFRWRI